MKKWLAYYPGDGETADDAVELEDPLWDIVYPEDAARVACEYDFAERAGWGRRPDTEFEIAIIAPDGSETRWCGHHELTVLHRVNCWVD